MVTMRVPRFWRTRGRCAVGILVCFCVLSLVPVGYGQTDRVSQLINELKETNTQVRQIASMALGKFKDPRAVEPLIAALKDPDPLVRSHSAYALGEIKDPRAVEPLIAALKDTDDWGLNPSLLGMRDSDFGVRRSAAIALGKIGTPAVEPLIAALKDPNSDVRKLATMALSNTETKDPRAISALLAALRERDTALIAGAGAYIFFIIRGEPGSEDALIEALDKSGNWKMAEVFLNCGNAKLENAGRKWWKRHHLGKPTPGGGQVRWGSKQVSLG